MKTAIIAHNCRVGGGLIINRHILKSMFAISDSEEYFLIYSKGYGFEEIANRPNCQSFCFDKPQTMYNRVYFESFTLPRLIRDYHPDVIFGPGNIGLSSPLCPQALFIHNAYLYHNSDRFPQIDLRDRLRTWALHRQVKSCLPSTQQIFVQTPVVQKRFSDHWNYPSEKIKILRFPVPVEIKPDSTCPVPKLLQNCRDDFKVLFLTRYMAHRNPEILLPLCRQYQEQFRKAKIKFITTLSSHQKGRAQVFLRNIRKNGLEDLVINAGDLSRQQVVQYYTHCDAIWLHTLMETLCLPYLEAMTMGVPILAPDFDFARYVCADAAMYYDPWNLQSLFESLMRLRESKEIRTQLIECGHNELKNRSKFADSWEQTALNVLENLKEIANK